MVIDMDKLLLPMVDGGIVNLEYDSQFSRGCETCDYGSSYVDEYTIILTKSVIHIHFSQMYSYLFPEAEMMKIMLGNAAFFSTLTEKDFAKDLKDKIECRLREAKTSKWSTYENEVMLSHIQFDYEITEVIGNESR